MLEQERLRQQQIQLEKQRRCNGYAERPAQHQLVGFAHAAQFLSAIIVAKNRLTAQHNAGYNVLYHRIDLGLNAENRNRDILSVT